MPKWKILSLIRTSKQRSITCDLEISQAIVLSLIFTTSRVVVDQHERLLNNANNIIHSSHTRWCKIPCSLYCLLGFIWGVLVQNICFWTYVVQFYIWIPWHICTAVTCNDASHKIVYNLISWGYILFLQYLLIIKNKDGCSQFFSLFRIFLCTGNFKL